MEILCMTRADFELPGVIETWAEDRGYNFQIVRPYTGETLLHQTDFLLERFASLSDVKR